MSDSNYTFTKKSFDEIYKLINSTSDIRSRLSLMAQTAGIKVRDSEELTERIFTAVSGYEAVKDCADGGNIDAVIDRILEESGQHTGLTSDEMLRRLDCCFAVFTDPVKVQLCDSGMTDGEFFAQYNAKYGTDIPEENLRASIKSSLSRLDISAYQLAHLLYDLSEDENVCEEAFSLAKKNFTDKCTIAMKIYLENDDITAETAAVTACAQTDIKAILYAAQKGDVCAQYIDYLIKGIIFIAAIAIIALTIHYGGFVELLLAIGKLVTSTLGITVCTNAITGLSAFTALVTALAFLCNSSEAIGRRIAYSIYKESIQTASGEAELISENEDELQSRNTPLKNRQEARMQTVNN